MFVGRGTHLRELENNLARAQAGTTALICVEGPPGIGKTSLIHAFLSQACPTVVVEAQGNSDEADLAFGVLSQLARSASVRSGIQLAELEKAATDADPIVLGRVLLDGLAELQTLGVVVVVVEDLHWVDERSATALRFALRRLNGDRVLAILSTRPGPSVWADEGWRQLITDRGSRLRLGGLDVQELGQMVLAVTGVIAGPDGANRLFEHTGGNPLYARCVIEELDPAELKSGSGPLKVPGSLASIFVARLAQCGVEAIALVSAAAVLGERSPLVHVVSLAEIDHPAEALDEAVSAGLVVEDVGPHRHELAFSHPLVRAAIYDDLGPARRVALHAAAARIVGGRAGMAHRVASVLGPDERLAADLAIDAEAALSTGSLSSAALSMWQAAEVSADPDRRDERMLRAFEIWLEAGDLHEVTVRRDHLEGLAPRWRSDQVAGTLAFLEGRSADAMRLLSRARTRTRGEDVDDDIADELDALLVSTLLLECDWDEALRRIGASCSEKGLMTIYVEAMALGQAGRGSEALALLDLNSAGSPLGEPLDPLRAVAACLVRTWTDDPIGGRRIIETALGAYGTNDSLMPTLQCVRAEACLRAGNLDEATASTELALSVLSATGRDIGLQAADILAVAAAAASIRGDWDLAERMVTRTEALAKAGTARWWQVRAAQAGWCLSSARDDGDGMLRSARALDEAATLAEPGTLACGPALAEALWRAGRLEEAIGPLELYELQAATVGRASAVVDSARVRGLIVADSGNVESALMSFEAAVAAADSLTSPFCSARFFAAYGAVLARAGKKPEALKSLRRAHATFEAIGATPYRERLDQALRRLGQRPSSRAHDQRLTATESLVARLVASGLSNREVAEHLVISRKGVEYHLGHVYSKMNVRSRTQLAAVLGNLEVSANSDD